MASNGGTMRKYKLESIGDGGLCEMQNFTIVCAGERGWVG